MGIDQLQQQLLIRRPGTAGHKHIGSIGKLLHLGQLFGSLRNGIHPIKTGITSHLGPIDTDTCQELQRLLILNKETIKCSENLSKHTAPRPEKGLSLPKYTGNQITFRSTPLQREKIIGPKFIFDKNRYFRAKYGHKTTHVARSVSRQVKDKICPTVVLSHLISRRRKKGQ